MSTATYTFTRTDIRKVGEMFAADLQMLALRTQAMDLAHAQNCAHDVCLMLREQCLNRVDIQLRDSYGNLVRVHRYSVREGIMDDSQRPGENRWPRLPNGALRVVVWYSHKKTLENLKLEWGYSFLSTDYSRMKHNSARIYSSNGYGMQRDTFVN